MAQRSGFCKGIHARSKNRLSARGRMSRPALPPCALPSVAPLGQRGREGVSIPPPYPLWTPYPPLNDQGMSPWTQMRKVAPGVWLKKLFTARQRYCASLFPGAIRPALRLCMRALRARLPNVPNEITIDTYTTKTTKRLFSGRFVFFVGFVGFVGFVEHREIVISLKSLLSWFSGGTVES